MKVMPPSTHVARSVSKMMFILQCMLCDVYDAVRADVNARVSGERRVGGRRFEGEVERDGAGLLSGHRLRARRFHSGITTSLQVLHDEHRPAVSHAVRTHPCRVPAAAGRWREDLSRHLCSARLHRVPAHDR